MQAVRHGLRGGSSGVGFLVREGVAVSAITPVGAAWRKLQSKGKLVAVKWPPRAGLPRGMTLLSVTRPGRIAEDKS